MHISNINIACGLCTIYRYTMINSYSVAIEIQ